MLGRILFSIFSLIVVVMIVMLLVYSLIDRKVILQDDDLWNKKTFNDRVAYEYSLYEKYGYITYTDYSAFLKEKYKDVENYENDKNYQEDLGAIKKTFKFLDSDAVAAFVDKYGYLQTEKYESFLYKFYTNKKETRIKEINDNIKDLEKQNKNPAVSDADKAKNLKSIENLNKEKDTLQAQLAEKNYDNEKEYKEDKELIKEIDEFLQNDSVREFVESYAKKGYKISFHPAVKFSNGRLKTGGAARLFAVRDRNIFLRLWDYAKNLIKIETTKDVEDPNLTDRYIRFENDPNGWFALVGSGTQHKYLLYFDERFPFIHQNFIHLNLGVSYTKYRGSEITEVITTPQGDMKMSKVKTPSGKIIETEYDIHSATYNPNGGGGEAYADLTTDNYTTFKNKNSGLSRIEVSFVAGIIATVFTYLLGLPLGILLARKKDKFIDHLGSLYIIFIMAVPSLAYIFMFALIGTTVFKLPYAYANAQNMETLYGLKTNSYGFVLPIVSLALPAIGGLMRWMRRFMIDQMNADYVKFARSQGLSEKEIYGTHISRNAMVFIVRGIPGEILGCLAGAIITESVYGLPGVGRLLTDAINQHDNGIIVACAVFYTTLSIISIILGDLLLIKYDPRISLSSSKGGGR